MAYSLNLWCLPQVQQQRDSRGHTRDCLIHHLQSPMICMTYAQQKSQSSKPIWPRQFNPKSSCMLPLPPQSISFSCASYIRTCMQAWKLIDGLSNPFCLHACPHVALQEMDRSSSTCMAWRIRTGVQLWARLSTRSRRPYSDVAHPSSSSRLVEIGKPRDRSGPPRW